MTSRTRASAAASQLAQVDEYPIERGPGARVVSIDAARRHRPASPPPLADALSVPALHPTLIARLTVYAYEVLEGIRPLAQLGGMITEQVAEELRERQAARAEARAVTHDERVLVPTVSRISVCVDDPCHLEATALLKFGERVRAVAIGMRYSLDRRRWLAHCLTVL